MGEDFKNSVFLKYKHEILNVFTDSRVIILVTEMQLKVAALS